jgi:hypothetical protein
MKVKFLCNFGGRETREIHYPPGKIVDLPDEIAEELVARGIVEMPNEQPQPVFEPEPVTPKRRRK